MKFEKTLKRFEESNISFIRLEFFFYFIFSRGLLNYLMNSRKRYDIMCSELFSDIINKVEFTMEIDQRLQFYMQYQQVYSFSILHNQRDTTPLR